jgi:dTDP-4-amino-4,6-dideoxygalactose transaminase
VSRPQVPADCAHNAHMYYLLLDRTLDRTDILRSLNEGGVNAVFHYVPLHASPAGMRYGRTGSTMTNTDDCSARLIRLPLWLGMGTETIDTVVQALGQVLATRQALL